MSPERRRPAAPPLIELPGPAEMARLLADLWAKSSDLGRVGHQLRMDGSNKQADAYSIAEDWYQQKIKALESLAVAMEAVSLADAAAKLMIIHGRLKEATDSAPAPVASDVSDLIEAATQALAVVAASAQFDLPGLGAAYMSCAELTIARREVPT
jgi:hypothetical protein